MNKVKITYEYRGLKAIPKKWFAGSEVVDESIAKERIKELSSIVFKGDGKGKKYRNIKIV